MRRDRSGALQVGPDPSITPSACDCWRPPMASPTASVVEGPCPSPNPRYFSPLTWSCCASEVLRRTTPSITESYPLTSVPNAPSGRSTPECPRTGPASRACRSTTRPRWSSSTQTISLRAPVRPTTALGLMSASTSSRRTRGCNRLPTRRSPFRAGSPVPVRSSRTSPPSAGPSRLTRRSPSRSRSRRSRRSRSSRTSGFPA